MRSGLMSSLTIRVSFGYYVRHKLRRRDSLPSVRLHPTNVLNNCVRSCRTDRFHRIVDTVGTDTESSGPSLLRLFSSV
jgi:hypothetical protein